MKLNNDLVNKIKTDYLTAEELAEVFRLKTPKTIRNWVCDGVFEQGKEVVRLRGVLLFYWPAIKERLHTIGKPKSRTRTAGKNKPDGCLINF